MIYAFLYGNAVHYCVAQTLLGGKCVYVFVGGGGGGGGMGGMILLLPFKIECGTSHTMSAVSPFLPHPFPITLD